MIRRLAASFIGSSCALIIERSGERKEEEVKESRGVESQCEIREEPSEYRKGTTERGRKWL